MAIRQPDWHPSTGQVLNIQERPVGDLFIFTARGLETQVGVTERDLRVRQVEACDDYLTALERAGYDHSDQAWPTQAVQEQWWPLAGSA